MQIKAFNNHGQHAATAVCTKYRGKTVEEVFNLLWENRIQTKLFGGGIVQGWILYVKDSWEEHVNTVALEPSIQMTS